MAITILPRAGSAGSEIAGQFGQGVSSGLQALANMKMQEYTNKQMYKQQQEAQEQQYRQAEAALDSIGQGQYKPFVRIPGGMKLMEALAQGGWNPPQAQQAGQSGSIQQTMNTLQPGPEQQQPGMVPGQQAQAPSPTGMQPTADLGQALRQAAMNKPEIVAADRRQARREQFELAKEERKEGREEKRFFHGEAKPFYEKVQNEAESALKMQDELDKMQILVKEGNLPSPQYANFVEKMGSGIFGSFINPNDLIGVPGQEYNKLAATLMSGAKDIFGSRVTNFDMAQFLKMIPTLMNTDEGKLEIIRDLSILNQMKIERAKVAEGIAQANKGYLPSSFRTELYKKFDARRTELANEFKKSALPKSGSKIKLSEAKNLPAGQRARFSDGTVRVWDGSKFVAE